MPRNKSAKKRVRQSAERRDRNRNKRSRMRTMMKKLRDTEDKEAARALLKDTKALIDRLVSKGLVHKNKAARYKSEMDKHVNAL